MNGGGRAFFSHGSTASKGVAVFITKELSGSVINIEKCLEGRYLVMDILQNDNIITLLALYAPNKDSPEFFTKLGKILQKREEHKIIIGDFNLTLDINKDRKNTYHNNNRAKEEVENLMDQYFLRDIWRIQNPDKMEYSWFKIGKEIKASRIDMALISGGLDQNIKMIQYLSSIKTDHRGICMVVDFTKAERGRGFWK